MGDAAKQAARLTDPVDHGLGLLGMLGGMLLGAVVGAILIAATVATGGGALAIAIAAVGAVGATAGGGLAGGQLMHGLSTLLGLGGITTGAVVPTTSPNVIVGGLFAARAQLDGATCSGIMSIAHVSMPRALIAMGAETVLINGMPAARQSDKLVCGGEIEKGEPTVLIGGPTVQLLEIFDTEAALRSLLEKVAIVSLIAGAVLLGAGFAVGAICGAVLLEAIGTAAVFFVGNELLGELGDSLGPGWRDTLQGGFGIAALVGVGAKGLRSIETGRPIIGEPVDGITGEVCAQKTDFVLPAALPLTLKRNYASGLDHGSCFGPKWRSTWGQWVEDLPTAAVYYSSDGRVIDFATDAAVSAGTWLRNPLVNKVRLRRAHRGFDVLDEERRVLGFHEPCLDRWLLTSIEDHNGNAIRFSYESGALREVTHSGYRLMVAGTPTQIQRIALVTDDGDVELFRYEYDEGGRLVAVIDGSELPFQYSYDASDRLVRWEDCEGTWYEYTYDEAGRCVEAVGPRDMYHYRFEYDARTRLNRAVDSYGGVTTFTYNERFQLMALHDPGGGVRFTTWDERSNKLTETDPAGRTVTCEYDEDGNVVLTRNGAGEEVRIAYDPSGSPLQVTDGGGRRWTRTYDAAGNVIETALDHEKGWRYERDPRGNIIVVFDPAGRFREFIYDERGLRVAVSDWKGQWTLYERDAFGRVTATRDPLGHTTFFDYDYQNQLVEAILPTGGRIRWIFNRESLPVRRVNPDGNVYSYRYGPFGLLEEARKPSGASWLFTYDREGRLSSVLNERDETHEYVYNATGQVVEERDFSGRVRRYEYDLSGLCVKELNGLDEATVVVRDAAGRVVARQSSDGTFSNFEYDAHGQLARALNESTELSFDRDAFGRVIRETQGESVVESAYDERGRRVSRTTNADHQVEWTYDSNGLVSSVLADRDLVQFSRDANGRETTRRTTAGFVLHQEYDSLNRLVAQATERLGPLGRSPTALVQRRIVYNDNSDPIEVRDARWGTSRYTYDPDGRILAVTSDAGSETFTYDAEGDLTSARDPAAPSRNRDPEITHTLGPGGRVEQTDAADYAYDADGRLVEKRDGDKVWRFAWTVEGRLRRCVTPDGEAWTYEYDAFGRRISKTGAGGTAAYVWDGDVIAREVQAQSDPVDWVHEPGSTRPLLKHTGRDTFVCVVDQSGAPRELVTTSGALAWAAALDLWGEPRQQIESRTTCPIRFQGQWSDAESGLHYNYHRYYAPDTGRYVTPDPIGLDGGARIYGYVHNPLSWIDPFGLGLSGVDFSNSPDLFPVTGNQKNIVQIPMQGSRPRDFTQAFAESKIPRAAAEDYTWHHVNDFDPATGKTTMQLVKTSAHEASLPHMGSVKQFEQEFGVKYGKPEAIAVAEQKGWLQGRTPCPR